MFTASELLIKSPKNPMIWSTDQEKNKNPPKKDSMVEDWPSVDDDVDLRPSQGQLSILCASALLSNNINSSLLTSIQGHWGSTIFSVTL